MAIALSTKGSTPYNTNDLISKANSMLAQTKAQGTTPYAGSSYAKALSTAQAAPTVKASTPLKATKVTSPTGQITETSYHAEPAPKNYKEAVDKYSQTSSGLINKGTQGYDQGTNRLNELSTKANKDYTDYTKRADQAYQDAADTNTIIERSKMGAMNNPNYSLDTGVGRAGVISQNYGLMGQNALTRASGLGNLAGLANSQQGLQQGAASSLAGQGSGLIGQGLGGLASSAGMRAPQPYGLTTQPYNPVDDNYGGGSTGGAINRAVQASNIGSAQDFQSKIQQTEAAAGAADANFSILNNYAQGFGENVPIANALIQKYGTTVQGNEAVAGFRAQLDQVRAAYQAITGAVPNIPDDITPSQLKQVQQALNNTVKNNITGYKNQLDTLKTTGSGSTSGAVQYNPDGTLKAVKF